MHPKKEMDHGERRDRLIHEHIHDAYKVRIKLHEPTVCPECGAVFQNGRWQWKEPPNDAHYDMCQACRRIKDQYPAGNLILVGKFVIEHGEEILSLIRNVEAEEKQAHPLHRIMSIEKQKDIIIIATTDIHLPGRLGEALHRSHKGKFKIQYDEEGYFARAKWHK